MGEPDLQNLASQPPVRIPKNRDILVPRQPIDLDFLGVALNDNDFAHAQTSKERKLVVGFVFWRTDLDDRVRTAATNAIRRDDVSPSSDYEREVRYPIILAARSFIEYIDS